VNDNVQREEQGIKKRIRGLAEWTVRVMIGLVILVFIWNWVCNMSVRWRATPRYRGDTQADTNPLLGEAVDKRKKDKCKSLEANTGLSTVQNTCSKPMTISLLLHHLLSQAKYGQEHSIQTERRK
jgi:hypothetical protein